MSHDFLIRAEKAEQERDEARGSLDSLRNFLGAHDCKLPVGRVIQLVKDLREERDKWKEAFARARGVYLKEIGASAAASRRAAKAEQERDELRARLRPAEPCGGCPGCSSNDCADALDIATNRLNRLKKAEAEFRKLLEEIAGGREDVDWCHDISTTLDDHPAHDVERGIW